MSNHYLAVPAACIVVLLIVAIAIFSPTQVSILASIASILASVAAILSILYSLTQLHNQNKSDPNVIEAPTRYLSEKSDEVYMASKRRRLGIQDDESDEANLS